MSYTVTSYIFWPMPTATGIVYTSNCSSLRPDSRVVQAACPGHPTSGRIYVDRDVAPNPWGLPRPHIHNNSSDSAIPAIARAETATPLVTYYGC